MVTEGVAESVVWGVEVRAWRKSVSEGRWLTWACHCRDESSASDLRDSSKRVCVLVRSPAGLRM